MGYRQTTAALDEKTPALRTDTTLRMNVFLLDNNHLRSAEEFVSGCERCSPAAELSFDYILDGLTGCEPTETEYLLPEPAHCPACGTSIDAKTLVLSF